MVRHYKRVLGRARSGPSALLVTICLSLVAGVHAQDDSFGADADQYPVEEIIVTGSRIARRDFVSPSPIATIDRSEIEASPHATLEDLMNRMPQVLPDYGRAANNPGDGTARINLRGLGAGRSLVLLNSRRLAPSGSGSAVDVNNIPQALIERVEVITGEGIRAVQGRGHHRWRIDRVRLGCPRRCRQFHHA